MSELYSTSDSTNSDGFPEVVAYSFGIIEASVGSAAAAGAGLAARSWPPRFQALARSRSSEVAFCPLGRIPCLMIMCRLWFVDCELSLPHTPQTYWYVACGGRSSSVLRADCLVRAMAKPSVDRGFVSVESSRFAVEFVSVELCRCVVEFVSVELLR